MRILNLFIAFSCVMLVFIMALLFSNFYIKDKGFSFSQNLYDSTKILPDVFTSTPRFFQSASLANKTRLSKEEKEGIARSFNAILDLASKDKICTGGSYNLEPNFYYEQGKKIQKGYNLSAFFSCEIKADEIEKYQKLLSDMSNIASLNGLFEMSVPSLNARISNEMLRKAEKESINRILLQARQLSKDYSKNLDTKCYIRSINFTNRQTQPRAVMMKAEIPNIPVTDEKDIEKIASISFYCEA